MSTQLSPSAYKLAIEEDLQALHDHMPDILERWHIEDLLRYSIHHFYPGFEEAQTHTKALRERIKELEEEVEYRRTLHRNQVDAILADYEVTKAEKAQLKEALDKIANDPGCHLAECIKIAKEALKNNE